MTFIPDLTKTEWWHTISLAYSRSIPKTFPAILVGWLGDKVPRSGEVPDVVLVKLKWAYHSRVIDQGALGEHECEICHNYFDRGELLIMDNDKMYVAPRMILHYIKDHSYRPPDEFMYAVNKINIK